MRITTRFVIAVIPLISAACGEKPASRAPDTSAAPAAPAAPAAAAATNAAPDSFRVAFETSRGTFVVQVNRAWAPKGADRFRELLNQGFFDDNRFFRVIPGFVAQFGVNGEPKRNEPWESKRIADDSVKQTNARGTIVFAAMQAENTRSHQLFVNLADNPRLDGMGFSPIGRVISGMNVVDSIYSGYGDTPDQQLIQTLGNSYLTRTFPKLDYIKSAKITPVP
jgi:peptidyl-prolyl cis-trans isomerase A (cyclophilin A)